MVEQNNLKLKLYQASTVRLLPPRRGGVTLEESWKTHPAAWLLGKSSQQLLSENRIYNGLEINEATTNHWKRTKSNAPLASIQEQR